MATLYKTNGEVLEINPKNGKKFKLIEVQSYCEGYIELVYLPNSEILIVNEEGRINGMEVNENASKFLWSKLPQVNYPLFGNVIHCKFKEL